MILYNVMNNKEKCMYTCLYLNMFDKNRYINCVNGIIAYRDAMNSINKKDEAFMSGYNCVKFKKN